MPQIYGAADVFALASLKEIFGIAFLEALACGVPCVGHKYPVTEWIIGHGGSCIDMQRPGGLARESSRYLDRLLRTEKSGLAREQALGLFSKEVVTAQILRMYETVLRKQH